MRASGLVGAKVEAVGSMVAMLSPCRRASRSRVGRKGNRPNEEEGPWAKAAHIYIHIYV